MLFAFVFKVLHSDQITFTNIFSGFFFLQFHCLYSAFQSTGKCCWWVVTLPQVISFYPQLPSQLWDRSQHHFSFTPPGLAQASALRPVHSGTHPLCISFLHPLLPCKSCTHYPGQHSGLLLELLPLPPCIQLYSQSSLIPVYLDQAIDIDRPPQYPRSFLLYFPLDKKYEEFLCIFSQEDMELFKLQFCFKRDYLCLSP